MNKKETVVLYHSSCPDGFGAAYAAWKKFGDTAEYIPVKYGEDVPEGLEGRDVYVVDFCYELEEQLTALKQNASRLVVLDHHESSRTNVENIPEHVFDTNRSGATIAWSYFHPDTPMPRLMQYLEDGDLYHYALPETRDIFSYLLVLPFEFHAWDAFVLGLEDDAARAELLKKARAYTEFFEALAKSSIDHAKKVRFEGYEVYFAVTHPNITMKSYVGNELYAKLPPFALMVTAHPDGFGVSIRGNGSVDVSKIAAKYGGGGHPGSSGFFIPNGSVMPWTEIED
ncbi:MAG: hypothetical protein WC790_03595 [Candidatus Paceibacterota bacterium]|jgi:hypothetical protein